MNNQATLDKFTALRLWGMKNAFNTFLESSAQLTHDELVGQLAEAEWNNRQNQRLERLIRNARFRYSVQIADLDFEKPRGLDKTLLLRLANGAFTQCHENVLITGPTGVGKSYIATALGHQACMLGYKTLYFNTRKLFNQLHAAMADGSYLKIMAKIEKNDLLILDDFGLQKLEGHAQQALMEMIEDRHQKRSTIIASQLPVGKWHDVIGDSAIADAVLDRLVHSAHRIDLKGESWRKKNNNRN